MLKYISCFTRCQIVSLLRVDEHDDRNYNFEPYLGTGQASANVIMIIVNPFGTTVWIALVPYWALSLTSVGPSIDGVRFETHVPLVAQHKWHICAGERKIGFKD